VTTKPRDLSIPAGFFGIVLGLVGLGNGWRLAARVWSIPHWIGETVMLTATAVWATLLILYCAKWIWARAEAVSEFHHPVLCCYVGIVPVSTALISLAIQPYAFKTAVLLASMGIVGQLAFGVYRTGRLWMGGRDPTTTTAVLYLPTVAGSFVSTIVLSAFGHPEWGVPFFGIGLLSWLAIESVVLHRLYTVDELPGALRPTLGIQLAPPTVGCAAYLSITQGPVDVLALSLIGYGLFQALVLIRLIPWIARDGFSPSYWAFTFGVSALALDTLRLVERGHQGPIQSAAPFIFAGANLVIGGMAIGTIWLLIRGRLLPPKSSTPVSRSSQAIRS
jgi:tellurite resistance protein